MTSRNPATVIVPLDNTTPGQITAAIKEAGAVVTKRLVDVPLDEINVYVDAKGNSLNARVADKAWNERVFEMAEDMKLNGYDPGKPIEVFVMNEEIEDGKVGPVIYIANGHTRVAAVKKANEGGAKIEAIPAIFKPAGTTLADVSAGMIRDNSGAAFTPYEQSVVVARMYGEGPEAGGMDADAIAVKLGKTKRYVQDLLVLASAPAAVKKAVQHGEIAAREAVKELRASGAEKAADKIASAVEKAKASGKKKATPATITGKGKATGKKTPPQAKPKEDAPAPAAEPEAPATVEPAMPDLAFHKSAIEFAVDHTKAADGIKFLKGWLAEEQGAVEALESWMGQPRGSWKDASLRKTDEDLDDL